MKKTALVTGASAGLGEHLARLFVADGHDVVVVARRREKLEALAAELQAARAGAKVHVIAEDLGKPGAAGLVFSELSARGVDVEFLVNNAGFGGVGAFVKRELARESEMMQLNIVTLVQLTHMLLPGMIARGSGKILNLGSTAGFLPGPFMAVYYASKAFVNSFTEALAVELEGTGVTATVSCPGATLTEFGRVSGNEKSALFKSNVMGAEEVAQDAYRAMMRGQVMTIPGGMNKLRMASLRIAPRGVARKIAAGFNKT
jgi:hypothetical protein